MLQGGKKALKLLSFKAFFVVRGTGLEPATSGLCGSLKHKSESFRLRFVLFTAIRSVSFPLFPSKPARFFLKCSPSQGHFHLTHSGSIPAGYSPVVM